MFLSLLAAFLGIALCLLALILLVPFHAALRGGYDRTMYGVFSGTWLWGLVRTEYRFNEKRTTVTLAGLRVLDRVPSGRRTAAAVERRVRTTKRKRRIPKDIPELLRIARKTVRALQPHGRIDATFGLDDPSETGFLFGLLKGLLAYLPLPLTVIPNFNRSMFMFEGEFSLRLWLMQLVVIFTGILLSSRGRALLRSL
jgi:hypothetical protein